MSRHLPDHLPTAFHLLLGADEPLRHFAALSRHVPHLLPRPAQMHHEVSVALLQPLELNTVLPFRELAALHLPQLPVPLMLLALAGHPRQNPPGSVPAAGKGARLVFAPRDSGLLLFFVLPFDGAVRKGPASPRSSRGSAAAAARRHFRWVGKAKACFRRLLRCGAHGHRGHGLVVPKVDHVGGLRRWRHGILRLGQRRGWLQSRCRLHSGRIWEFRPTRRRRLGVALRRPRGYRGPGIVAATAVPHNLVRVVFRLAHAVFAEPLRPHGRLVFFNVLRPVGDVLDVVRRRRRLLGSFAEILRRGLSGRSNAAHRSILRLRRADHFHVVMRQLFKLCARRGARSRLIGAPRARVVLAPLSHVVIKAAEAALYRSAELIVTHSMFFRLKTSPFSLLRTVTP